MNTNWLKTTDKLRHSKYQTGFVVFILVFLTAAVYVNSLNNSFLYDDKFLIVDNPFIKNWGHLGRIFTTTIFEGGAGVDTNFYRPLQTFSYLIDHSFWKLNPAGYHLTNVLWHLCSVILLYFIVHSMVKDFRIAFLAAAFFAVHPIHTEAVTYVSGRADPQSGCLILLSFLLFLKSIDSAPTRNVCFYPLSVVSFALALLTKETVLIFPFAIVLADFSFSSPSGLSLSRRIVGRYLAFFLTAGVYLLWRMLTIKYVEQPGLISMLPLSLRLLTTCKAVIVYLGILLVPIGLHMERSITLATSIFELGVLISIVILVLIAAGTVRMHRLSRPVFFAIVWFFLHLLPVSNLYPLNAALAEHWLYLSSAGYFAVLATALVKAAESKKIPHPLSFRKKSLISLVVLLFAFYGALTIRQNAYYWKDEFTFCKQTLKYNPGSDRLHNNLGTIYYGRGMLDEAIAEYQAALEINPNLAWTHNNLGAAYKNKGLLDEAVAAYKEALKIEPDYINARLNLGLAYAAGNRFDEAVGEYRKILKQKSDHVEARYNLAAAYHNKGRLDKAAVGYQTLIQIKPDYVPAYYGLGVIYASQGEYAQAERLWKQALMIDPAFKEARDSLRQLARDRDY